MFNHFPHSDVDIVAPDGTVRSRISAMVDSKQVTIPDPTVVIHAGDEIRRTIPNGTEEVFEVLEVNYQEKFHVIPAHLIIKTRRKGAFKAKTGGNYSFHVHGPNARINFNSVDNSQNYAGETNIFKDIRAAFRRELHDVEELRRVELLLSDLEAAKGEDRRLKFNNFVQQAANYMTIAAPFIPALTDYIK
ncbi:hypothetical protein [Methylobacterium oryzae]|uniref:hypothetical protein n=1 Tax=Methylobacterium oryzae TaxID=334852 RepID=UPI001F250153|nr:hypothetical protein [Methylobacterium oryzae]UIN36281.1 hypothetical protein LXM90_07215 [Methylobacterium oryzae]